MILLYSGLGGLVIPIFVVVALVAVFALKPVTPLVDNDFFMFMVVALGSALVCWPIGRWLNKPKWVDQFTEEKEYRLGGPHALLFIPFQYWSVVFVIIAVACYYFYATGHDALVPLIKEYLGK